MGPESSSDLKVVLNPESFHTPLFTEAVMKKVNRGSVEILFIANRPLLAVLKLLLLLLLARLYESIGRAIAVTPASASASALALASASALLKMLKFLVKVFMSLHLLKLWMDQVDTLHVGRYWSEVLCCTIMTHLSDLEVKVTDLEKFFVKVLG